MTHWVLITGGIGSGKTTVTNLLSAEGVPVIDTDIISRELTKANGLATPEIRDIFGQDAITEEGALDRDWMRNIIYQDLSAKTKLENILHPIIFTETVNLQRKISSVYGFVAVPVFSKDSVYRTITERILVIDVDYHTQVNRVKKRDQLTEDKIAQIIASQISREDRLVLADDVILNNKDELYLTQQVYKLHRKYLHLFS